MTKLFFTILFVTFSFTAIAQVFQHGLILPEQTEREGICCIYSPEQGFTVYNKPGGAKIGTLTRNPDPEKEYDLYYQMYFVNSQTQKASPVSIDKFREIGYKIWALTYFERRNGYVRVIDRDHSYWIRESEIERYDFRLTEWQDFLHENTAYYNGYFAVLPGLNLREDPNADSNKISVLRGTINRILPTDEHSGPWTKVKVIIHKENPCETRLSEERNLEEELEGWIKIVDDHGKPNVWYYPRGC